jgi:hypothetical protein
MALACASVSHFSMGTGRLQGCRLLPGLKVRSLWPELFGEWEPLVPSPDPSAEEVAFVSAWVWGPEVLRTEGDKNERQTTHCPEPQASRTGLPVGP